MELNPKALPALHKTKIFIVEDSRIVRERLKERLSEIPKVRLVGESESVAHAKEALKALVPDIIILDIRMPDGSGMSILKELMEKEGPMPIVMIYSAYTYPIYREAYLQAGANYFFDKNEDMEKMMEIIGELSNKKDSNSGHAQPALTGTSEN